MALFPSLQWLEELRDLLNASEEYRESASDFEGSFTIVCGKDGLYPEDVYMWINPYHGRILEVSRMESEDERQADFLMRAPYSVWKQLVKGEIDSMRAIITGQIGVEGNLAILLKRQKASQALMQGIGDVPTEFADER